jgi:CRISPR-associated protein Cas5t
MTSLPVVKVVIEAPVTSFRYPHFLIGRQITYDMPPPSTIYGHVASALGELLPPQSFRFGYHFQFRSRASDLEHQHIISAGGLGGHHGGQKYPVSVQATIQPHERDFLFQPKLTLYLTDLSLLNAFRNPIFCVVLGRSQDLAQIVSVEEQELQQSPGAYFEGTLVPFILRPYTARGATVLMPRWIEPPPQRRAHFERFITLNERVYAGNIERRETVNTGLLVSKNKELETCWTDPSTPLDHGVHRGVFLHSCAGS